MFYTNLGSNFHAEEKEQDGHKEGHVRERREEAKDRVGPGGLHRLLDHGDGAADDGVSRAGKGEVGVATEINGPGDNAEGGGDGAAALQIEPCATRLVHGAIQAGVGSGLELHLAH